MPTAWIAILAVLLLISLLANGLLLWLSCWACRVRRPEGVSFKRALAVTVGVLVGGWVIAAGEAVAVARYPDSFWPITAGTLAVYLVFLFLCFRVFLSATAGKAVLVILLWNVFVGLFALAYVPAIKVTLGEAYVVPTGAMADTIWGHHKTVTCPACGLTFAINAASEAEPWDGRVERVFACTCPSCRQRIHFPDAPGHLRLDPDTNSVEIRDPGLEGGDRFFASGGFLGRKIDPVDRWDAVVFYYPGSEHEPPHRGVMKYLQRLVGLPGETIAIHGGNLYALAPDKGPKWDDQPRAKDDPEKPSKLSYKSFMHVNAPEARRAWDAGQFQVLRKSPETLLAMMRLVFDNDHPGKGLPERWGGEGWQGEGRGFRADGKGDKTVWLRYSHLPDRGRPARRELITDFMGYNTFVNSYHPHPPGENWVNDLILECEVVLPDKPSGELTLELSRGVERYRAGWDLGSADGLCTLYRVAADGEKKLESKPTALARPGAHRLRFANVDDRLTVWVDGTLPFGDGVAYSPPAEAGPKAENDLEPAGIGVRGAAVGVRSLKLFRDVYYTANDIRPSEPDVAGIDFANPETWDGLRHAPVLTMYVQPGHYLCLGDNSPESSDSRSWGSVPERLLLGKALFVYYPIGRAGRLR
jgi:signal peptidase I